MKYREKLGYIALGGFLMLVGMLAAGVMLPLGAQDKKADLNVGQITCTGLTVASENRTSVMLIGDTDGGFVQVGGFRDGQSAAVTLDPSGVRAR